MKRSKTFLTANILSALYSIYLLWTFGNAIIEAGGMDFIDAVGEYFELAFDVFGVISTAGIFLYTILVLLCIHILSFVIGCIIGWIAYVKKESGGAKFAAVLYLVGTICFPIYFIFGLPITIIGFIGAGKQKKLKLDLK